MRCINQHIAMNVAAARIAIRILTDQNLAWVTAEKFKAVFMN